MGDSSSENERKTISHRNQDYFPVFVEIQNIFKAPKLSDLMQGMIVEKFWLSFYTKSTDLPDMADPKKSDQKGK